MNASYTAGDVVVDTPKLSTNVSAAIKRALEEHSACRSEIQRLAIENARLSAELARARARNDDLTRSAEIWIRMYERLVARTTPLPTAPDIAPLEECRP
jgi:hypothetical protein